VFLLSIILENSIGNLRRILTYVASNKVSQLRRSTQALLNLASPSCSVTFLLSFPLTNHDLLAIRFYRAKIVNSTRLCSGGQSRIPGNSKGTPPPQNTLFILKADSCPFSDGPLEREDMLKPGNQKLLDSLDKVSRRR
jgi:hypothetical protein